MSTTSKTVTSQLLGGMETHRHEDIAEGHLFRSYVQMQLPIGEVARALLDQIKANDVLEAEVRASDAYRQLELDVAKYKAEQQAKRPPL